jgi:hypothetical protein
VTDDRPNLAKDDPAADPPPGTQPAEPGSVAVTHAAAVEEARQAGSTARREALRRLETNDAELAALLADGRAFVRCGDGCGFLAVSADQNQNRLAVDRHECPDTFFHGEGVSWVSYVFPWPAIIIVATIVWGIVVAMRAS